MDFGLNDHQRLIRDTVRAFMETEVRPNVKEWERTEHFPAEPIRKLAEMGCCGMLMPEEWGGPGLDTISYVLMIEEVARVHAAMSTALAVTNSAVQIPVLAFGSEDQKNHYLRALATGEILGALETVTSLMGQRAGLQTVRRRACTWCSPRPIRQRAARGLARFWWNPDSLDARLGDTRTRWGRGRHRRWS